MPPMPRQEQRGAPVREASTYHRPSYGYQLPSEWVAPDHFIADYESHGLSRPASGFGWSRYYDDAVLTDQWGRVYDWRDDVNWADRDERYSGDRGRGRWDNEGHGDSDYRDGHPDRDGDYRRDGRGGGKTHGKKYDYRGRWTGSWNGGPVQSYNGEWHGSVHPHWAGGYNGGGHGGVSYGGGYGGSYGYDAGGTTVTTVIVQNAPVMTRMVSYDVVSYVPVRKKVVRRWKPRPKPACACGS
jgi:hypothetical protein